MPLQNNVSIYKIDTTNHFFDGCENDFKKMIQKIMTRGTDKINLKKKKLDSNSGFELIEYALLPIRELDIRDFNVELYHAQRTVPNSWNYFLSDVVINKNQTRLFNHNHDFIVFVYDTDYIFCFTGGVAFSLIDDICDEDFPKDLMVKIVDPEKIKRAKNRGLVGNFYARELYYRGNYTISATEAFGSVWNDVRASVRDSIRLDEDWKLILGDKTTRDLNCDVKSSFKIKKRFGFQDVIKLIKKLKKEYQRELSPEERTAFYFLNTIKIIKNLEEKNRLIHSLSEKAYQYILGSHNSFDFDFCHKKYQEFLEADGYTAKKGHTELGSWNETLNAAQVLHLLKDTFDVTSLGTFKHEFTNSIKVISNHSEDEKNNTSGTILEHLHGELLIENKTYFLIDKEWCRIEDDFLKILHNDFKQYLDSDIFCDLPLDKWTTQSEGQFNELHLVKENFLVADRITLNGIELFDLLYFKDNDLYIIQVKDGLGASSRDACSQLRNSSRMIEESIKSNDHKKIKAFYQKLQTSNTQYTQTDEFKKQTSAIGSESDFVDLFIKSKKRHYVLATRFGNSKEDIKKTNSNIAKFELLSLRDHLRMFSNSEFKIYQIKS